MFKCDNCGKITKPDEKANMVTVTLEKEYEHYTVIFDKKTRRKKKEFYTTTGYEPVTEMQFCKDCYEEINHGEDFDGEDTQGKRRADQVIKRRGSSIERGSKVNGSNTRRIV